MNVGVFFDPDGYLLGLKPQPVGYKMTRGRLEVKKLRKYGIKFGKYKAEWNVEHEMVIIKVEQLRSK